MRGCVGGREQSNRGGGSKGGEEGPRVGVWLDSEGPPSVATA